MAYLESYKAYCAKLEGPFARGDCGKFIILDRLLVPVADVRSGVGKRRSLAASWRYLKIS